MKRYIITTLYAFVAYCAWGQLNAPCFTIPIPENTPATYSLHHFTQDSTVIDLDNTLLYALAISGEVTLQTESNSSVKVILIDNYGVHHLVYEVNSLLADTYNFTIENVGRETLWDNPIYASQLLVRLNNASLTLNAITPVTELLPGSAPQQRALRTQEQNDTIVAVLNRNLIARDIPWRAGTTEVSSLPYEEKRILLGDNNPFHNFEYYIGGYYVDPAYEVDTMRQASTNTTNYVEEFDWRNRHGRNWITPVRNQGRCNSCGPFATVALLESYTNLYFNKLFNLDLSEQEMVSRTMTDCDNGIAPIDVSVQIQQTGIMAERDLPYNSNTYKGTLPSINIPITYTQKLHIDRPFYSCHPYLNSEGEYKELLFQSPFCFGKKSDRHVMLLVGYKTAKQGDIIHDIVINDNNSGTIVSTTIEEGNKYIGQTVWICKNSWGNIGINGYAYILTDLTDLAWCSAFNGLLILEDYLNTYNYDDVEITDNDGDGYYYWGIGVRPLHIPEWVPYMKDGDDGNPYLGPMNSNGHCSILGPTDSNVTILDSDRQYIQRSLIQGDLIIPPGITAIINPGTHIFMHPDAKIIINGGKVILDGGVIHNGHILNKGTLIVKNGGSITMRYGDEYVHNPENMEILNNGKLPFPISLNLEKGSFVPYK